MPRRNSRDPESDPAAAFGEALGRIREAAGFATQEAAAARLNYGHDTISRWETGAVVPDRDQINRLLDQYNVTGLLRENTLTMWRLARKAKGPIPEFAKKYFGAAEVAEFLRFWAIFLVPGPLQIRDYALAMYDLPGMDKGKAAETVALRMERQSIIEGPDAPQIIAVLHEAVLYNLIGVPEVMVRQMDHLLDMLDRPNVTLQVIRGKGAYWGLSGAFQIASGHEIPDTLLLLTLQDQTMEESTLTREALTLFEKLRSNGLNVEDTRAALMEAKKHWESQQ